MKKHEFTTITVDLPPPVPCKLHPHNGPLLQHMQLYAANWCTEACLPSPLLSQRGQAHTGCGLHPRVLWQDLHVPHLHVGTQHQARHRPECLGDSLLHDVHHPHDPSVTCPADPFHIDWVTISGGTITDLTNAFIHDYKNQVRPMRVFVSAGLNDIIKGADKDLIIGRFIRLNEVINEQNNCHPPVRNELVIATLLTPPKLVWFDDNGPHPPTTRICTRSSRI